MEYAYLIADVILLAVWLGFFLMRPDVRRQMLIVSAFSAPLAPISQVLWFHIDYWHPPYAFFLTIRGVPVGIEEVLFAFAIGGIGSVIYQVVFRKAAERGERNPTAAVLGLTAAVVSFLVLKHLAFNTIWASTYALLLGALFMALANRQLAFDALLSAALVFVLTCPAYWLLFAIFPDAGNVFWVSGGLSGANIMGAPLEEMAWLVAWGAFSGVLYESWSNVRRYVSLRTS